MSSIFEDIERKDPIGEKIIGFIPLEYMDAATIADSLIDQAQTFGLDLEKMHGQGYDGCKTMAG